MIILDLITNRLFYLSLMSVVIFFTGIDMVLVRKRKILISLIISFFGLISLLLIVSSVFSQLDSFKMISFESSSNHIEILENLAVDQKIKFEIRTDSAKKVYLESGRRIDVLQKNGEVTLYSPSHEEEIKRDERLSENSKITKNISNNKLAYKLLLGIIAISSILASTIIFYRLRKFREVN